MKRFDVASLLGVAELAGHLQAVQQELERVTFSDNPQLQEPITRLIAASSKRLRSSLLLAVVESQAVKIDEKVITACTAIELAHIASLVHDDIIDNASTRWKVATVNHQEGVGRAIVVGDYLLAKACLQASLVGPEVASVVASAIAELCSGQAYELADQYSIERSQESLLKAMRGKTAALFAAACQVGGLCAGLPAVQVTALTEYGENFGMSFQLVDDVLDFVSTPELLGKPVGNDVIEGVYTLPVILALQSSHTKEAQKLLQQKASPALADLLVKNGFIQKSLARALAYNQAAAQSLKATKNTQKMAKFPAMYQNWAVKNLVADRYDLAQLDAS